MKGIFSLEQKCLKTKQNKTKAKTKNKNKQTNKNKTNQNKNKNVLRFDLFLLTKMIHMIHTFMQQHF